MNKNGLETKDILPYLSNKIKNLIIFPTEQCNFRCYYCYEDYKLGRMSVQTICSIKNYLDMIAHDLELLTISWFGGEPLLASDIVLEISEYANVLSKKFDFVFKSNITTNGYCLTPILFNKLIRVGITEYQISLDGPRKIHDETRVLSNGKGTFEKIWRNIIGMHKSNENIFVILRIHIDENKLPYISELINMINIQLNGDNRFKVFLKNIATLGGRNDSNLKPISPKKMDTIIHNFNNMLNNNMYINNFTSCYASHPNSLIIRSDGRIGKCTVALTESLNDIGQINLDGTISIDNSKLQYWVTGILNKNKDVALCPFKQAKS